MHRIRPLKRLWIIARKHYDWKDGTGNDLLTTAAERFCCPDGKDDEEVGASDAEDGDEPTYDELA